MELHQAWVHVTGVPYPLRHFLRLWAVGTLIGTTINVDLLALHRRGIVRILVGMASANCFKKRDEFGPYIKADGVLKLKGFDFTFRPEPADYVPEVDFVPFIWSRNDYDDPSDKDLGGDSGVGKDALHLCRRRMVIRRCTMRRALGLWVVTPWLPRYSLYLLVGL